jgi:hypothetical protein
MRAPPGWRTVGMVWYGTPPTSWAAIDATRWWHLDRAPAELWLLPGCLAEPNAQTESVPSALVRRWVSFPQAQAVAELRACVISLCLERQPPSSALGETPSCTAALSMLNLKPISWSSRVRLCRKESLTGVCHCARPLQQGASNPRPVPTP